MHSSRTRTVRCSGHLSCHACPLCHAHPLAMYAPSITHALCHVPLPATHTPSIYAPLSCTPPCHACPPLLHMPSAMHAPCHTPLPPRIHAPLPHICENITFPQLLLRMVITCNYKSLSINEKYEICDGLVECQKYEANLYLAYY